MRNPDLEIFVPERVLTRGEAAAYERYVEWRAERAGRLVDERINALELKRRAEIEAARRRKALAEQREAEEKERRQRAAERRRACEAEKVERAAKIARRMRELGFRHPHAPKPKRQRRRSR